MAKKESPKRKNKERNGLSVVRERLDKDGAYPYDFPQAGLVFISDLETYFEPKALGCEGLARSLDAATRMISLGKVDPRVLESARDIWDGPRKYYPSMLDDLLIILSIHKRTVEAVNRLKGLKTDEEIRAWAVEFKVIKDEEREAEKGIKKTAEYKRLQKSGIAIELLFEDYTRDNGEDISFGQLFRELRAMVLPVSVEEKPDFTTVFEAITILRGIGIDTSRFRVIDENIARAFLEYEFKKEIDARLSKDAGQYSDEMNKAGVLDTIAHYWFNYCKEKRVEYSLEEDKTGYSVSFLNGGSEIRVSFDPFEFERQLPLGLPNYWVKGHKYISIELFTDETLKGSMARAKRGEGQSEVTNERLKYLMTVTPGLYINGVRVEGNKPVWKYFTYSEFKISNQEEVEQAMRMVRDIFRGAVRESGVFEALSVVADGVHQAISETWQLGYKLDEHRSREERERYYRDVELRARFEDARANEVITRNNLEAQLNALQGEIRQRDNQSSYDNSGGNEGRLIPIGDGQYRIVGGGGGDQLIYPIGNGQFRITKWFNP